MKKAFILAFLLLMVSGCSSWHNDNYPDPAIAKAEFKKDRKQCEERTTEKLQIGTKDRSRTNTTNRAKFSANYSRTKEFERCMRARGWIEK